MKLDLKKYIHFLANIIGVTTLFVACEEVIDLDLDTQEKQLVVDASVDWNKGQGKAFPMVDLSYTMPFFDENSPEKVSNATVKLLTSSGQEYELIEATNLTRPLVGLPDNMQGIYVYPNGITPVLDEEYTITINTNGKNYIAKDKMKEVPTIDLNRVEQRENAGILKDRIELRFFFDASPNEESAFLVITKAPKDKRQNYFSLESRLFSEGKFFFTFTGQEEKLEKGDIVEITLYRISSEYKQTIDLLVSNAANTGAGGGSGLFSIPSRVYGNIINTENTKDNPLGAFRVSQYTKVNYVVK